jgi:hypothetical protein
MTQAGRKRHKVRKRDITQRVPWPDHGDRAKHDLALPAEVSGPVVLVVSVSSLMRVGECFQPGAGGG